MRTRPIAVSAALLVSATALTGTVAHADSSDPTTYYVSQCAGTTGTGTQADPFCQIQQAAAVATVPGDTVVIEPGNYTGEVDITASGTAAAPITFELDPTVPKAIVGYATLHGTNQTHGLSLSGASYIDIEGIYAMESASSSQVLIQDSSHIDFDGNVAWGSGGDAIQIAGSSSDVTISRTTVTMNTLTADGIDDTAAGPGIVLTTNLISGGNNGIAVTGSPGVTVTSNSVNTYCRDGILLADSDSSTSAGATIENNTVFTARSCGSLTGSVAISAATSADTVGTVENYNDLYTGAVSGATEYAWAGTVYPGQAAFSAATGQGSADHDSNPAAVTDTTTPAQTSPVYDAANSDAPGELDTDIDGHARVCDPNILPSGVGHSPCYDRGALEHTDTVTMGGVTLPADTAPSGTALTFKASTASSSWPNATFQYTYLFGDGTTATSSSPTVTHTYAASGASAVYSGHVTASSQFGGSMTQPFTITIDPATAPTATLTTSGTTGLGVQAAVSGQAAWTLGSETIDWGDGNTSSTTGAGPQTVEHSYVHPGVYTVTYTVTDAGGETVTKTSKITTLGTDYTAYGPTRLLDTRKGQNGTASQLANNGTIDLKVAGVGTIPAGVTAVALNLTALDATGAGYIAIGLNGSRGASSSLNYTSGGVYTNSVIAPVSTDGTVHLVNSATRTSTKLDLLADITGYFAPVNTSGYSPITPTRVMDTRSGLGGSRGKLAAGKADVLKVAGSGSLPASGITAVSVNLTVTDTTGSGFVAAYPDGGAVPGTSNENWSGSTTKAIAAIVPVGSDGKIDLRNGGVAGSAADVIVDVTGYFSAASPNVYVPAVPQRLFDTRQSDPVAGGASLQVAMPNYYSATNSYLPTIAYVLNTTVTGTEHSGWLSVVSDGNSPTSSTLNWTGAGQTTANLTFVTTNGYPYASFFNSGSKSYSVNVIGDLVGYFVNG